MHGMWRHADSVFRSKGIAYLFFFSAALQLCLHKLGTSMQRFFCGKSALFAIFADSLQRPPWKIVGTASGFSLLLFNIPQLQRWQGDLHTNLSWTARFTERSIYFVADQCAPVSLTYFIHACFFLWVSNRLQAWREKHDCWGCWNDSSWQRVSNCNAAPTE